MRFIVFIITLIFSATTCFAGPFGTEMGDAPEKFGVSQGKAGEMKETIKIPEPNPSFVAYEVGFVDNGLMRVTAYSKPYNLNAATILKEKIENELRQIYGKPSNSSSILSAKADLDKTSPTNVRNQMIKIANSIPPFCIWKGKLPDDIESIILFVEPIKNSRDYKVIQNVLYHNGKDVYSNKTNTKSVN